MRGRYDLANFNISYMTTNGGVICCYVSQVGKLKVVINALGENKTTRVSS